MLESPAHGSAIRSTVDAVVAGTAAPLPYDNLDTDQIMPKQFLLGIDKSGLAKGVFHDLRTDAGGRPKDDFVLNREIYRDAGILIAGANFGCGSSREHAVWGLQQAGFQAVIASSFGEIFYFNSIANGLLALTMENRAVQTLLARAAGPNRFVIDVASQYVETGDGERFHFQMPERQKRMFLEGLDTIGLTLKDGAAIDRFAQRHFRDAPWMKIDLPAQSAL
ncbi:3-isopropylmalate dehydratase small subunit [Robbsia sp. Bb-Pol-6]|uniref:3-isopropylmalate dehydratase n=1 Tax=Robbsia betulipollinis TaxID=2981849 RepID=A0ABT3ZJC4_9BURK|nr:3-isopropylmalate dehydratase small subunit [Robbsia betulipollinis]MCY0386624.1 3-isopropylmalate dehydratase small subunit [Robbsia betulipollinis]